MGGGLKYTSAYLLASMKGEEVTADMITSIFKAGGVSYEQEYVDLVVSKMSGKAVADVIKAGISFIILSYFDYFFLIMSLSIRSGGTILATSILKFTSRYAF